MTVNLSLIVGHIVGEKRALGWIISACFLSAIAFAIANFGNVGTKTFRSELLLDDDNVNLLLEVVLGIF
ncbi:hypothetical protein EYC84_007938 [Monilinia fructicola]|uniref:Uncharacterized protein n=1 Tax=Monilinia fructicola TaxID=38448 RepID=A0A5M9JPQ0_MONFR|nr:hypothetical protein EYC84_007938 [Monilinia fructicola]